MSEARRVGPGRPTVAAMILTTAVLLGCSDPETTTEAEIAVRGNANVGADVVSTVDGFAITVADVEAAARLGGVEPETALRRLQQEQLLWLAARRAGYADRRAEAQVGRQTSVQALLEREVEGDGAVARIHAEPIEPEALAQALAALRRPERRGSVHIVAHVAEDASPEEVALRAEWIEEQWRYIAQAHDPESAVLEYRRRTYPDLPFEVTAEDVAPVAADYSPGAYLTELFRVPEVGMVAEPFRSEIGIHILVLTELVPAHEPSTAEAERAIRDRRVRNHRVEVFRGLIRDAADRSGVEIEPEGARAFYVLQTPTGTEG